MVIVASNWRGALREITACVAQAVVAGARLATPGQQWNCSLFCPSFRSNIALTNNKQFLVDLKKSTQNRGSVRNPRRLSPFFSLPCTRQFP
jgi:hypothetical protein